MGWVEFSVAAFVAVPILLVVGGAASGSERLLPRWWEALGLAFCFVAGIVVGYALFVVWWDPRLGFGG